MSTYAVTRKSDGVEVYRYSNGVPVEWDGMPFADYDHTPVAEPPPPTPVEPAGRRMSKLDYLRLFTIEERVAIRTAGKTEPLLEDYLHLLNLADEVNTGDQEVKNALALLESVGLLAPGRGLEVLNG